MPLPMVERILSQAGQGGLARQVHFHLTGEPLLYPELSEAVRITRDNGMEAWVTTNGSLLTPRLLEEFRAAGLSHLTISLQTPDAPTFDLRGSRLLSFIQYRERLIGAARAFLSHGAGMHLSICFLSSPLRRLLVPNAPKRTTSKANFWLPMNYGFRRSIKKLTAHALEIRPVGPACADAAEAS